MQKNLQRLATKNDIEIVEMADKIMSSYLKKKWYVSKKSLNYINMLKFIVFTENYEQGVLHL